ncbi:MAG: GNAT family N-acetyltransferase [Thermoanaerobaculia bacterium]|nr:GNAT family N-acetyltransferase [Thermoanaerobaculia bacterium]
MLQTERLGLRPVNRSDIDAILALAGDRLIADTMISIPHPLTPHDVESWIGSSDTETTHTTNRHFAARRNSDKSLVGVISLRDIDHEHRLAELSFWIGRPFWGHAYATEGARAVIGYAFTRMGLNRLQAFRMVRNEASGKVLLKLGFREEGRLRQRVVKWGVFEDVVAYGILKADVADSGAA